MSQDPTSISNNLLKLLNDQELISRGLVHFYGDQKPWGKSNASGQTKEVMKLARNHWHHVHDSLELSSKTITSLEFVSPLTDAGLERYRKMKVLYEHIIADSR